MSEDEGMVGQPMDAVEILNSIRNLATTARAFYLQLVEEGFSEADALRLTATWIGGISGGRIA